MVHDRIVDGISDEKTTTFFNNSKVMMKEAVEFAVSYLQKEGQPPDDYRELLELSLIYMGRIPPRGIHLVAPGAIHQARWMAKAIYLLKLFLLPVPVLND